MQNEGYNKGNVLNRLDSLQKNRISKSFSFYVNKLHESS